MSCTDEQEAEVKIELLVNGSPIEEQTIPYKFKADESGKIRLCGSAKLVLDDKDVVAVRVTPIGDAGRRFRIPANGAYLTVERLRFNG